MSDSAKILDRHRGLTADLSTRTSKEQKAELKKIAKRNGWHLSDAVREAICEFIEKYRTTGKPTNKAAK